MDPYTFASKNVPDEALGQRKFWYDRAGNLYEIEKMTKKHALNAANRLLTIKGPKVLSSNLFAALINRAS